MADMSREALNHLVERPTEPKASRRTTGPKMATSREFPAIPIEAETMGPLQRNRIFCLLRSGLWQSLLSRPFSLLSCVTIRSTPAKGWMSKIKACLEIEHQKVDLGDSSYMHGTSSEQALSQKEKPS